MKAKTYIETVGRRKTAIARVRLSEAAKPEVIVNGLPHTEYFKTGSAKKAVVSPFAIVEIDGYSVSVKVSGGGLQSQAEAIRHGIARALIKQDVTLRSPLKKEGMLRRDPRAKERRKFGLKKARKAPQWSKR
jgi:small subunit ribosomal protein S9